MKRPAGEAASQILVRVLMLLLSLLVLYPFVYALAYSLSDSQAAVIRNIVVLPVEPTLDNYARALRERSIYTAFLSRCSAFTISSMNEWSAGVSFVKTVRRGSLRVGQSRFTTSATREK